MTLKITLKDLKEHSSATSLWIAIHDKVYDVTKFKVEHPGGEEILLGQAGGFATDPFEDVGHSTDARELMKKFHIGEIVEEDKETNKALKKSEVKVTPTAPGNKPSSLSKWIIPIIFALTAALIYQYVIAPMMN